MRREREEKERREKEEKEKREREQKEKKEKQEREKAEKEQQEKEKKEEKKRLDAIKYFVVSTCCSDVDYVFGDKHEKDAKSRAERTKKNNVHKCGCGNKKSDTGWIVIEQDLFAGKKWGCFHSCGKQITSFSGEKDIMRAHHDKNVYHTIRKKEKCSKCHQFWPSTGCYIKEMDD